MDRDTKIYRLAKSVIERRISTKDKAPVPMKIATPLFKPFQKVALDFVGPLPKTHAGNRYTLASQDHISKYPEAFALPHQKATSVAKVFVE